MPMSKHESFKAVFTRGFQFSLGKHPGSAARRFQWFQRCGQDMVRDKRVNKGQAQGKGAAAEARRDTPWPQVQVKNKSPWVGQPGHL